MAGNDITIDVSHIVKNFRVYGDKSHTFKDRILFSKRNKYKLNHVIDDISFQCKKGEAIGLIGHNGCGKSTTLKLLNRILYPDSGTITMRGKISSLIELGAGFHPDMTGRENIYINATIFGLKKKEIDKRLDKIIRFSELEDFIDNPVRTYSSGMYMRLAFSVAINVDADILLVDEILAVGDANFQRKCFDKLKEIKENGATIVIVSHSMDQIKSICDRVLWIDAGKIREDGPAQKVCDDYIFAMDAAAAARKRLEEEEEGKKAAEDPNKLYPVQNVAVQCSDMARRSGKMNVRFTSLQIEDADGKRTQSFAYGKPFVIKYMALGLDEGSEPYNVIFDLYQKDGPLCSSFSSYLYTGRYFKDQSEKGISYFRIDQLGLAEGDYVLEATLANYNGEHLDHLSHLIEFHVTAPSKLGTGLVAMKNEWT